MADRPLVIGNIPYDVNKVNRGMHVLMERLGSKVGVSRLRTPFLDGDSFTYIVKLFKLLRFLCLVIPSFYFAFSNFKMAFIQRPVVFVGEKKWVKPIISRKTACWDYQQQHQIMLLERQQFADIIKGMVSRRSLTPVSSEVSFASVAKKNATPEGVQVIYEPKYGLYTDKQARQDFSRGFELMKAQKRQARLLVEAIAKRYPILVRRRDTEQLDNERAKRALLKAQRLDARRERRSPGYEVTSFSKEARYESVEDLYNLNECLNEDVSISSGKVVATSTKQIKKRSVIGTTEKEAFIGPKRPVEEDSRERRKALLISQLSKTEIGRNLLIAVLATKLKTADDKVIDWLANQDFQSLEDSISSCEEVKPQMETEPVQGDIPNTQSKSGNVVLSGYDNEDRGQKPFDSAGYVRNSVATESQTFSQMTERWLVLDTIDWKTIASMGTILYSTFLPKKLLEMDSVPNTQLLYIHALARTGLKLKFMLNSNKFQVGQIMAGITYTSSESNAPHDSYISIASLYQRNHVLMQAGKSNDAELVVPYHHINSTQNIDQDMIYARLDILVMNPLLVTQGVSNMCRLTIAACFDNMELMGSVSRNLIYNRDREVDAELITPQMDTISNLANAGSKLLSIIGSDNNRDNPPVPLQPVSLIPQSVPSFAYMNGVPEPVNVLRSDPRGQTPHFSQVDEMNPLQISRTWGLLKRLTWTVNQVRDTEIFSVDLNPDFKYEEGWNQGQFIIGVYPPITVIQSMYGYWRGDFEFKFQIVASAFHTGRLMIGVIPTYSGTGVNVDSLRSSPNQVFDIAEGTEFIFRAPYYSLNAWSRTNPFGKGKPTSLTSKLYCLVLNPLITIDSVSPTVYVNISVRAADNYEIAIPRLTHFSPRWGTTLRPPTTQFLKLYNKELAVYSTWERNLTTTSSQYLTTFYIQNVSDGWSGFTGAVRNGVYKLKDKTTTGYSLKVQVNDRWYELNSDAANLYGVADPDLSNSNAQGLVLVNSLAEAQTYSSDLIQGKDRKTARSKVTLKWVKDSQWSQVKKGEQWENCDNSAKQGYWQWEWIPPPDVVRAQMDTEASAPVISLDQPAMITQMGLLTFGERTPDLKDLTRRWVHYGSIKAKVCTAPHPRDCAYTAKLPIHPYRNLDPQSSASFDNRARQGTISLIGSHYLLWRGSMRFRFVVTGVVPDGVTLYVQHRFDEEANGGTAQVVTNPTGKVTDIKDLLSTQYATYVQALSVNSISTIEVPYYQPNEGLYTIPTTKSEGYSNGLLYVWLHGVQPDNVSVEVYYSFGDDARFSVWQGSPPLFDMRSLDPEPQMDTEGCSPQGLTGLVERIKAPFKTAEKVNEAADSIKADVSLLQDDITKTTKSVREIADSIKTFVSPKKESFTKLFKRKKDESVETTVFGILKSILGCVSDRIFKFATHFIYCILAPKAKIVGWCIVNIYHELFGFTLKGVDKIATFIGDLWTRVNRAFSSKPSQRIRPQMEDELLSNYAGSLFTLIASVCGVSTAIKGGLDLQSCYKGLFITATSARAGSYITSFVKDNITLFKNVYSKFLGLFGRSSKNYSLLAGVKDPRVQNWLVESQAILTHSKRDKVLCNPVWSQKVFELCIIGKGLLHCSTRSDKIFSPKLDSQIRSTVKELNDLEKQLIQRKVYSPTRYEPFCLWLGGPAGTLKSTLACEISAKLAIMQGNKASCYTMTAGQKYFDGYSDQNTIMLDDFLTLPMSADPEVYAQYLQMKSPVPFNPPYAKVDDKDRCINFSNLIITANPLDFNGIAGIHDYEAYNRRRDCLLKFVPKNYEKLTKKGYTYQQLQDFEHVRIFKAKTPYVTTSENFEEILPVENTRYADTVIGVVLEEAKRYHTLHSSLYAQRAERERAAISATQTDGDSLDDWLAAAQKQFTDFSREYLNGCPKGREAIHDLAARIFDPWISVTEEAAGDDVSPSESEEEEVEAQGDKWEEFASPRKWEQWITTEPNAEQPFMTKFSSIPDGELIEPVERIKPWDGLDLQCLHDAFDMKNAEYDWEEGLLTSSDFIQSSTKVFSVPVHVCYRKEKGKAVPNTQCLMMDNEKRKKFFDTLFFHMSAGKVQFGDLFKLSSEMPPVGKIIPVECLREIEMFNQPDETIEVKPNERYRAYVETVQSQMRDEVELVGPVVLQKKTPRKSWSQKLWDGFVVFCKALWMALKVIIYLVGILATIIGLICWLAPKHEVTDEERQKFLDSFNSKLDENNASLKAQLHSSGDPKIIKGARSVRGRSMGLLGQNGEPIPVSIMNEIKPTQNFSSILKKIERNSFTLCGFDSNQMMYKCRCLGVVNKDFIMIKHYYDHFIAKGVQDVKIITHNAAGMISYKLSDIKFVWPKGAGGYGRATLPDSFPTMFANVAKYMPSQRFDQNYPREICIAETFFDKTYYHRMEATKFIDPLEVPQDGNIPSWTIEIGLKYPWGDKGRCGSLILAESMACPLVAIHTAGIGKKQGFAELLFKEDFIKPDTLDIEMVVPQMGSIENTFGLSGEYLTVGTLDSDMKVTGSKKSKIIPSEIQGVFDIKTYPAPLSKDDPRLSEPIDPVYVGVSKRTLKSKEFPSETLRTATVDLYSKLSQTVKPLRDRVGTLSVKQSIEGIPDIYGYEPIEMSTAEGFPWQKMRPPGCNDKSWMFSFSSYPDGRKCLNEICGDLDRTLKLKNEMRERRIVPPTYFSACLKDSRLPIEKISIPGKTRIFEISPIDLTIQQRAEFLDFDAAYCASRLDSENTIGINPDGPEWTELVHRLMTFSPCILTADFSGFGPQLNHAVLMKTFDITSEWYYQHQIDQGDSEEKAEKDWLRKEVMKSEITHGLHIVNDTVFRPTCGLPSGNSETVVRNSLGNSLYIRMAYLTLALKHAPHLADMYWFRKLVLLFHNGDDLIMAVKPEIIEWFNNVTLIEFFAQFDIKMTDALKSGNVRPFCSIQEASYLKRGFAPHPNRKGHWMAPLEEASITDTANWIWKSVNDRIASLVNSEQCCRLAYTRGQEFYDMVCKRIKDAWRKKKVDFQTPSWYSLDCHVWEGTEGPKFIQGF